MTYAQIVTYVTDKIGETDDYSKQKCLSFVQARHRLVYNSYDWVAAQDTLAISVAPTGDGGGFLLTDPSLPTPQPPVPVRRGVPPPPPGAGGGSVDIPVDCEKIIAARFNQVFLDPVTASYIFESHPEMFLQSGKPQFYWARYESDAQSTAVRLFPAPDDAGTLELLIKRKFDDSASELLIPNIEDVVICYVLADMWEFMRQLGIYGEKLKEAQALLVEAQQRDVPATPKPRTSKNLTASGSTLAELTDAVCDIIGRWEPDIRESVRDRVRRNYSHAWDTLMLPESLVIANVPIAPEQEQVVLPSFFDRVLEVRTNLGGPLTLVTPLKNREISYYFNVDKDIFERSGEPTDYAMLSSVAVEILPPYLEQIKVASDANSVGGGPLTRHPHGDNPDAGIQVFFKGLSSGRELSELVEINPGLPAQPGPVFQQDIFNALATTLNPYDEPLTISKPDTLGNISFYGATSKALLLTLGPKEHEKKCLRLWLLPNENPQNTVGTSATPGSVLVLGKRRVSPLLDDLDSPQLRNIANLLINAAASDMFDRLGNADQSTKYSAKAAAEIQTLTDAETKQNAYHPIITPYVDLNDTELECF